MTTLLTPSEQSELQRLETIIEMTAEEARTCIEEINNNLKDTRFLLLDLYEREGWKALGYDSWRACVVGEFKQQQRYLYYQLEAAKIERNLCTKVQNEIPESQLRPLSRLEPEQQQQVWQRAVETAPEGGITAAHVKDVIYKMSEEEDIEEEQREIELRKTIDPLPDSLRKDSRNLQQIKHYFLKACLADKKKFRRWLRSQD